MGKFFFGMLIFSILAFVVFVIQHYVGGGNSNMVVQYAFARHHHDSDQTDLLKQILKQQKLQTTLTQDNMGVLLNATRNNTAVAEISNLYLQNQQLELHNGFAHILQPDPTIHIQPLPQICNKNAVAGYDCWRNKLP